MPQTATDRYRRIQRPLQKERRNWGPVVEDRRKTRGKPVSILKQIKEVREWLECWTRGSPDGAKRLLVKAALDSPRTSTQAAIELDKMSREESPRAREFAINALCEVGNGSPEAMSIAIRRFKGLTSGQDRMTHSTIVGTFCQLHNPRPEYAKRGIEVISKFAGDREWVMRHNVARALGNLGKVNAETAIPAIRLLKELAKDSDASVCLNAVISIGEICTIDSDIGRLCIETLEPAFRNPSRSVSAIAASDVLGKMYRQRENVPRMMDMLLKIMEKAEGPEDGIWLHAENSLNLIATENSRIALKKFGITAEKKDEYRCITLYVSMMKHLGVKGLNAQGLRTYEEIRQKSQEVVLHTLRERYLPEKEYGLDPRLIESLQRISEDETARQVLEIWCGCVNANEDREEQHRQYRTSINRLQRNAELEGYYKRRGFNREAFVNGGRYQFKVSMKGVEEAQGNITEDINSRFRTIRGIIFRSTLPKERLEGKDRHSLAAMLEGRRIEGDMSIQEINECADIIKRWHDTLKKGERRMLPGLTEDISRIKDITSAMKEGRGNEDILVRARVSDKNPGEDLAVGLYPGSCLASSYFWSVPLYIRDNDANIIYLESMGKNQVKKQGHSVIMAGEYNGQLFIGESSRELSGKYEGRPEIKEVFAKTLTMLAKRCGNVRYVILKDKTLIDVKKSTFQVKDGKIIGVEPRYVGTARGVPHRIGDAPKMYSELFV